MDKIKPCPFCGSKDLYARDNSGHYVVCKNCDAYGPYGKDDEEAIQLWNHAPRVGDNDCDYPNFTGGCHIFPGRKKSDIKMKKCCKNCVHISKEVGGKVYCAEEVDLDYSCKYWEQVNPFESNPRLCWSCKYSYVNDECVMYCGHAIGNPEGYVCDKWEGADETEDVKASESTPLNPSNSMGLDTDTITKIAWETSLEANVRQLLEEASELIVACCKYLRATGDGETTPVTEDQALTMIGEELADVNVVGRVLRNQSECLSSAYTETCDGKADRWLKRLNGKDDEKTP